MGRGGARGRDLSCPHLGIALDNYFEYSSVLKYLAKENVTSFSPCNMHEYRKKQWLEDDHNIVAWLSFVPLIKHTHLTGQIHKYK